VALIYARFDVAFTLARRAPLQGLAWRLQTSQDLFEQKSFNIRHYFAFHPAKAGKQFGWVICLQNKR